MLDLSKKIYKNRQPVSGDEYHNWYSKYYIPQSHCSKQISIKEEKFRMVQERDVDIEGNLAASRFEQERTTAFINWQHPLMDTNNIILDEDLRGVVYDNVEVLRNTAQNVGQGNNPFFHIEHLLEVKGPMASIESLVLPANQLTLDVLNADAGNIENGGIITRVDGSEPWGPNGTMIERRDLKYLNIADARERFVTFKDVFLSLIHI